MIRELTKRYLRHQFDVLGSGWVNTEYGMNCQGMAGVRFPPFCVLPKTSKVWFTEIISRTNIDEATRIFSLIDKGYKPINWQLDIKSGYRWSAKNWYRSIPLCPGPGVDIKAPWELARMHHLAHLALACISAKTGSTEFEPPEVYSREFRNQVLDFIALNPPRFGVNWKSAMDVGIRAANWLVAYDLFRSAGVLFDPLFDSEFQRSIFAHGRHIINNLEWWHRLRGNHYLSNIAGLLFISAYLPRSKTTDAWLAFSVQELIREVEFQFNPDGSNFEASTCYHRLSAEMVAYSTALVLGLPAEKRRALGEFDHKIVPRLQRGPLPLFPMEHGHAPFPPWYFERLNGMAHFTKAMTKPNNLVAQIGDNDSGRFLKMDFQYSAVLLRENFLAHGPTIETIAAIFADASGRQTTPGSALVAAWSRGARVRKPADEASSTQHELAWSALLAGIRDLPESRKRITKVAIPEMIPSARLSLEAFSDFGYYIFRRDDFFLGIRCGSIGQKGNGGHAHNDQLAIELFANGKNWIRDPGTYLYTPSAAARNRYRSVKAHFAPQWGLSEPGNLGLNLFTLPGPKARCLYFGPEGFVGRHDGFGFPLFRMVRPNTTGIEIIDWVEAEIAFGPSQITIGQPITDPVSFSPGYGILEGE